MEDVGDELMDEEGVADGVGVLEDDGLVDDEGVGVFDDVGELVTDGVDDDVGDVDDVGVLETELVGVVEEDGVDEVLEVGDGKEPATGFTQFRVVMFSQETICPGAVNTVPTGRYPTAPVVQSTISHINEPAPFSNEC